MHPSVLIYIIGCDFDGFICDYVFMFFPPSFLRAQGGADTRIRKSSQRRMSIHYSVLLDRRRESILDKSAV